MHKEKSRDGERPASAISAPSLPSWLGSRGLPALAWLTPRGAQVGLIQSTQRILAELLSLPDSVWAQAGRWRGPRQRSLQALGASTSHRCRKMNTARPSGTPFWPASGVALQSVHRLWEPKNRVCLLEIGASAGATADSREPLVPSLSLPWAPVRQHTWPPSPAPPWAPPLAPSASHSKAPGACAAHRNSGVGEQEVAGNCMSHSGRALAEGSEWSTTAWKGQRALCMSPPAPIGGPVLHRSPGPGGSRYQV